MKIMNPENLRSAPTLSIGPNGIETTKINEEERIQDITENIVKLVPTLIDKKIDTFSSKVNQNLNGI